MDINQTPLSGYNKSNKTLASRQSGEAKVTIESSKSKDSSTSSSQIFRQPELKEGQYVKGRVIDLRYNEASIQLEPGKQIVNAKVAGGVPLSIGQEAQFQVTEDSSKQLVLKYIPSDTTIPSDATVLKALSASNLPMTDRNKAIVAELLNQRMPVDKQTLQNFIRLSLVNRDATPLTLVLMYKNNIPMTSANIKQFEAYQKGTHQILSDLKTISKNIVDLLKQPDAPQVKETLSQVQFQAGLQNTVQDEVSSTGFQQALQVNSKLVDLLYNNINTSAATTQINNILNQQELSLLSNIVEQKIVASPNSNLSLPSDILQQITSGTLTLDEATQLITNLFSENTEQSSVHNLFLDNTSPEATALLTKLLELPTPPKDTSATLNNILGQQDRTTLLQNLINVPDTNNRKEQIALGNATINETLNFIRESLSSADKSVIGNLLQAPEYAKLLEGAFLQKWTISPEKVATKDAVTGLFQQLKEDLEQISLLTNTSKDTENLLRYQEPVKNTQENLQFMKDLNEAFTYLQLPVQFKDREAHADLYVMTRKRALQDKKEALSVLLHLEMNNLGSLNVHIKLDNDKILTTFYLDNTEAIRLINDNLPSLTSALEKKGYHIHAEVKDEYKKPDFSKDFIEQSSQDNDIKRYTFDIRT